MKYLVLLFLVLPTMLISQDKQVELLEIREDGDVVLKGVNNVEGQTITMIVELKSVGFGLKKIETLSKRIPSGEEVEIIRLTPKPNRQCSYEVNYKYTVKQKPVMKGVDVNQNMPKGQTRPAVKTKEVEVVERPGIVVYSKQGCGRCEYVTNYLELNDIPFTDLNISTDTKANDEMSAILFGDGFAGGTFKTPVVTVDGKVYYNIKDIKAFSKEIAGKK